MSRAALNPLVRVCITLTLLVTLTQCGDPESPRAADSGPGDASFVLADAGQALRNATSAASLLNTAIQRFLSDPNEGTRTAAVDALYPAHDAWLAAWAGAAVVTGAAMSEHAFSIDAWPVTPGFLDTLPEYPQSGMVADVTLPLTEVSVRQQHGFSDDSEVALGFHAIWHLLTTRSVADFVGSDELASRRRLLLGLQAELLFADLQTIGNASRPETVTLLSLMSAGIRTLEQAHALARAADQDTPHLSRDGPAAAAIRVARPVTTWLSHAAVRRWLSDAHPRLRDRLAETLGVLEATASDVADVGTSGVGVTNNRFSNDGIPDEGVPNEGVPNELVPNEGVPNERVPNEGVHDEGVHDDTLAGEQSPGASPDADGETDTAEPDRSRLALALRASIQVLKDTVRAERARIGAS